MPDLYAPFWADITSGCSNFLHKKYIDEIEKAFNRVVYSKYRAD